MFNGTTHQLRTLSIVMGAIACVFVGMGLLIVPAEVIKVTDSLGFCTSCHEMADNNFAEYKDTIHAHNRTGVKAICADCHVPHEIPALLLRKVMAGRDLFGHFAGTLDTKEKFEAHRLDLAKRVWIRMKETDSRECRNCHDSGAMAADMQGRTAQKQHKKLSDGSGATCIDCHFGIAHKPPQGGTEPQDAFDESQRK